MTSLNDWLGSAEPTRSYFAYFTFAALAFSFA